MPFKGSLKDFITVEALLTAAISSCVYMDFSWGKLGVISFLICRSETSTAPNLKDVICTRDHRLYIVLL